MDIYRVTFIGHREIERFFETEEKLDDIIQGLIRSKLFVEFYVGNHGEFDTMAISAIWRARAKLGGCNNAINLVLPYKIANMDLLEQQFEGILIPEELQKVHPKRAITERNHWMIDHSDLLVCYVNKDKGGAAESLRYAKKNENIKIMNICPPDWNTENIFTIKL